MGPTGMAHPGEMPSLVVGIQCHNGGIVVALLTNWTTAGVPSANSKVKRVTAAHHSSAEIPSILDAKRYKWHPQAIVYNRKGMRKENGTFS
jgi:hypothetical protein